MSATLPNLFIAGFAKCGTTTTAWGLHHMGAASLPRGAGNLPPWGYHPKEPLFFTRPEAERERWCGELYSPTAAYRLDATPFYIYDPSIVKEIGALDAKVILLMRHPVARAISWWNHHNRILVRVDCTENWGLPRSLTMGRLLGETVAGDGYPNCSMLRGGEYHKHIGRLLVHIPRHRIHFAFLEELVDDPQAYYGGICDFLGAAPDRQATSTNLNGSIVWAPPDEVLGGLEHYFAETLIETKWQVGRVPTSWESGNWRHTVTTQKIK